MTKPILLIGFWILSLILVLAAAYKFQKLLVSKSESDIQAKDDEIEKTVDSESINQLVDDNNKG